MRRSYLFFTDEQIVMIGGNILFYDSRDPLNQRPHALCLMLILVEKGIRSIAIPEV